MPFSGGGGGALQNHVHDNTPLQGGPLNFNNTTIGGMNPGDITFSDGAALQTLTYPAVPAGETLTASAASVAPSWQPAAAGAWTVIQDTIAGNNADLTVGGINSAVFSGFEFIRVIGTFSQTAASNYFNLQFYNTTVQIGAGNYASQGIFGSRVLAIMFLSESSIDSVPLGFCGTSTPVYFDMTFSVQGNGNPTYYNRNGEQKSCMNGGHGHQINMNTSLFSINSASDLCGFTPVAGGSGSAVSATAGSVYMKILGA